MLRRWWRSGWHDARAVAGSCGADLSVEDIVGINLAIQDAVAAANILSVPLRENRVTPAELLRVQARREFPTRMTQRVQVLVQNRIITRVLGDDRPLKVPTAVRLLGRWRWLRGLTARFVRIGVRPEHIHSPDALKETS